MKKLVVLILFMFMASLASAALVAGDITWTVVGNQLIGTGTATGITVKQNLMLAGYGGPTAAISIAATGYPANGLLSQGVSAAAGNLGKNQMMTGPPEYYEVYAQDTITSQVADVVWFTFDIDATEAIDIHVYSGNFATDYGGIEVPEPMTMALLGLGGLVLSRRRKTA